MKKITLILLILLMATRAIADSILIEGFEYGNHDLTAPVGWTSYNQSWLCGYLDKDHNRTPHTGNWYAFTDTDEAWMFMELNLSDQLKYRLSSWAISEGGYQLEIWAGTSPTPEGMIQQFVSETIHSDDYEQIHAYVETLSQNFQFIGVHAIAQEEATCLTIDDLYVEVVDRYDMDVTPYQLDTVMVPGTTVTFNYMVHNTGYEAMQVLMNGVSDYFTDVHFTADGMDQATFPTEPNQMVQCSCTATLSPDAIPGTRVWIDIMITVSCDCITRMATIWATVITPTAVDEQDCDANIKQVEFYDLTGKSVDPTKLKAGLYIERTISEEGITTRKVFKH